MTKKQTRDELEKLFENGVDETMGEFYEKIRKLFKKERIKAIEEKIEIYNRMPGNYFKKEIQDLQNQKQQLLNGNH